MKIKLYSDAHLPAASKIFPERIKDAGWFERIWTVEEISLCKELETDKNLPFKNREEYDRAHAEQYESCPILKWYLDSQLSGRGLSIACGDGWREFGLVKMNPDVTVTAMDIAPYVEGLNFIRQNNEEKRLEFKRHDALALPENAEGFDFVVSHGLTYCLTDFEISELFRRVMKVLKPEGVFLLSDAAFLNFRIFAGRVVRRVMSRPVNLAPAGFVSVKYKQTGWYRSPGSVRRLLTATNNAVLVENINCPKDIHNPCTRMFKLQKKSTL